MGLPFIFLIIWLAFIIVVSCATTLSSKAKSPRSSLSKQRGKRRSFSSDGHVIPREQDITCETLENHHHELGSEPRYIVHEDPPEGYVILNGVKRKISDCKNL